MTSRKDIFQEELIRQYPSIGTTAEVLAEEIDSKWSTFKENAYKGVNGDWTVSGQIVNFIWDTLGGGSRASFVVDHALRRIDKENSDES